MLPRGLVAPISRKRCLYYHHLQQLLLCAASDPALAVKVKQSHVRFSLNYSHGRGGDGNNSETCSFLLLLKAVQACRCTAPAKAKAGASHSSHGLLSLPIPTALLALQQRSCQFCMHPELCASQHWAPDGQVLDRGDDGEVFKSLL